jgi:hypothetical protein
MNQSGSGFFPAKPCGLLVDEDVDLPVHEAFIVMSLGLRSSTKLEVANCDLKLGRRRTAPYAFTEHRAIYFKHLLWFRAFPRPILFGYSRVAWIPGPPPRNDTAEHGFSLSLCPSVLINLLCLEINLGHPTD